jgi:hypothetical protein
VISSSPRGEGSEAARQLHDPLVVEIEPRHGVVGLRDLRLLLDRDGRTGWVELDHAVPIRIVHVIGEHRRAIGLPLIGALQQFGEVVAEEDVVAEDQVPRVRD